MGDRRGAWVTETAFAAFLCGARECSTGESDHFHCWHWMYHYHCHYRYYLLLPTMMMMMMMMMMIALTIWGNFSSGKQNLCTQFNNSPTRFWCCVVSSVRWWWNTVCGYVFCFACKLFFHCFALFWWSPIRIASAKRAGITIHWFMTLISNKSSLSKHLIGSIIAFLVWRTLPL